MDRWVPRTTLLNLPRSTKRIVVLLVDACLCVLSLWLALYLRLGEFVYIDLQYLLPLVLSVGLAIPIFIAGGLYRTIFRYSGWPAVITVTRAVGVYGLMYATIFTVIGINGTPRTVGIIQPILLFMFIGCSRGLAHHWLGRDYKTRIGANAKERLLIYGAGTAGRQIASTLADNPDMKVMGFLDDDVSLTGQVLNGLTIYHPKELSETAAGLSVTNVLLALPSISHKRRQEIIDTIRPAKISVRTLPSFTDIALGKISVSDIRELDINDLLGRAPVDVDNQILRKNIFGKSVMITGAGGSIGSELCRQILAHEPLRLILVDHSEFSLYKINEELLTIKDRLELDKTSIHPILTYVQDRASLERAFMAYSPEAVYHAAAYKHVPLVEQNPFDGILNNIFGTKVTSELALKYGVSHFVLISTDKAVRPTNVMGATKRWAELIIQDHALISREQRKNTHFCAVRFGNVLGSSGSVVPLFRDQIARGGPVTVTHPDVTRFFMSIEEAVGLVLQAGSMSSGGEIFLLDMGEPVKIKKLAEDMIGLSGFSIISNENPDGDVEIIITGLRPGEKLYEELLIDINSSSQTPHPKIYKASEPQIKSEVLQEHLNNLLEHVKSENLAAVLELLLEVSSGNGSEASA